MKKPRFTNKSLVREPLGGSEVRCLTASDARNNAPTFLGTGYLMHTCWLLVKTRVKTRGLWVRKRRGPSPSPGTDARFLAMGLEPRGPSNLHQASSTQLRAPSDEETRVTSRDNQKLFQTFTITGKQVEQQKNKKRDLQNLCDQIESHKSNYWIC